MVSVEFASTADGNFSFFYVGNDKDENAVKQWLSSPKTGLEIIAETTLHNQPVIIAKGKTQDEVLSLLKANGETFSPPVPKKKFVPWKIRGTLSIIGQSFDLLSVWQARTNKTRHPADNLAYLVYSLSNMSASIVDIVFGGRKIPDVHRMRLLKTHINETLQQSLPKDAALPAPDDKIVLKRDGSLKESLGQKSHNFIKHNSVYLDTALRWLGNVVLIFPASQWKAPKWKDKINKNPFTIFGGASFALSKIFTMFSKIPDPYNPKPPSTLDKIRENVLFRASSAVGIVGDVAMGYNGFFGHGGKDNKPNSAAGIANTIFTGGDTARLVAPFGTREVDIPELGAFVAQGLAKAAPDKLPQLLADVSSRLKTDLQDNPVEFGQLFTQVLTELNKYYGISLPAPSSPAAEHSEQDDASSKKTLFADDSLRKKTAATASAPPQAYMDKISGVPDISISH